MISIEGKDVSCGGRWDPLDSKISSFKIDVVRIEMNSFRFLSIVK